MPVSQRIVWQTAIVVAPRPSADLCTKAVCIDNFRTGSTRNLAHLAREPRFEVVEADVVGPLPSFLSDDSRLRADAVFNLACAASPRHYQADPEHTLLTCVLGTRNLLRLAEGARARFLLASTSEVYGDPEVHPQPEHYQGRVNPTGPRACYDEGKRAAETLTFDYGRAGRLDVRVARIFNTYGPRIPGDDGRVVSNAIAQALAGEDVTIHGDGSQTRSFFYCDDLIDGLLRLMAAAGPIAGPLNLGDPAEITVAGLVGRVLALTGSRSRVVTRPLPVDGPRRRRPDVELAGRLLGWSPRTGLDDGLRATIAWFAAQPRVEGAAIRRPAEVEDLIAPAEAPPGGRDRP